ncbi:MAG: HAD family hydrolase [Candidatus Binatia bacterium]
MRHPASCTDLPAGHADVLVALGQRHRLALVSNFDHAPTAHGLLARHGIDRHFAATLISADFGRRKPHPAIFHEATYASACRRRRRSTSATPTSTTSSALLGAGLDVAWLAPADAPVVDPAPTHRIATLADLVGSPDPAHDGADAAFLGPLCASL